MPNKNKAVCPKCGSQDHVNVLVEVWVRLAAPRNLLCDNLDTTDDLLKDGTEAWCASCSFDGIYKEFTGNWKPEPQLIAETAEEDARRLET